MSDIKSLNPVECQSGVPSAACQRTYLGLLFSFAHDMCLCMCVFVRSGFSQPGQRSLLKKALGVMAGRLKEGGADLSLEQLVK